jgi:hypothetical protein
MQAEVCIRLIPIYDPISIDESGIPYELFGNFAGEIREPTLQYSEDDSIDQAVKLIYEPG